ncbi:MAG: tetratricopeptide repeat protein [Myxococcales bacterium]|nr:tetratricopeptide repeat protein [Myxococcales bacterium]
MRVLCVASLTLLAAGSVSAQQPEYQGRASKLEDIFAAANLAASRGNHGTAIARYQELVAAGVHDPDVYFNLGTSLAQSGDYPRAIFNFERALTLRPGDGKASENLRNAERALEETRAEAEGEASIQRSSSISDALYSRFTENGLAYALLVANLAFFGVLAWAWARRSRGRGLYTVLVSSAVVLVFSALGLAVKSGVLRDGPRAVVLEDRVTLREGPDPRARVRGEARGGDRAELVDQDRDFVKMRVIGGPEGWAPTTALGRIDSDDTTH